MNTRTSSSSNANQTTLRSNRPVPPRPAPRKTVVKATEVEVQALPEGTPCPRCGAGLGADEGSRLDEITAHGCAKCAFLFDDQADTQPVVDANETDAAATAKEPVKPVIVREPAKPPLACESSEAPARRTPPPLPPSFPPPLPINREPTKIAIIKDAPKPTPKSNELKKTTPIEALTVGQFRRYSVPEQPALAAPVRPPSLPDEVDIGGTALSQAPSLSSQIKQARRQRSWALAALGASATACAIVASLFVVDELSITSIDKPLAAPKTEMSTAARVEPTTPAAVPSAPPIAEEQPPVSIELEDVPAAPHEHLVARDYHRVTPTAVETIAAKADHDARDGRFRLAADGYRHALTLSPNFVPARIGLANALWDLGDHDEARSQYERLVAELPASRLPSAVRERASH